MAGQCVCPLPVYILAAMGLICSVVVALHSIVTMTYTRGNSVASHLVAVVKVIAHLNSFLMASDFLSIMIVNAADAYLCKENTVCL